MFEGGNRVQAIDSEGRWCDGRIFTIHETLYMALLRVIDK